MSTPIEDEKASRAAMERVVATLQDMLGAAARGAPGRAYNVHMDNTSIARGVILVSMQQDHTSYVTRRFTGLVDVRIDAVWSRGKSKTRVRMFRGTEKRRAKGMPGGVDVEAIVRAYRDRMKVAQAEDAAATQKDITRLRLSEIAERLTACAPRGASARVNDDKIVVSLDIGDDFELGKSVMMAFLDIVTGTKASG